MCVRQTHTRACLPTRSEARGNGNAGLKVKGQRGAVGLLVTVTHLRKEERGEEERRRREERSGRDES